MLSSICENAWEVSKATTGVACSGPGFIGKDQLVDMINEFLMDHQPQTARFKQKKYKSMPGMCWCGHTRGDHVPIPVEPAVHSIDTHSIGGANRVSSGPLKQWVIERTEEQIENEQEHQMCLRDGCVCEEFKTAFQEEETDIDLEGELGS